jgi:DNA-binding XRE family transcriptional regulator
MKEIVGKKYDLTTAREKLKMSQQQLAEHIGVSQGTVCRWETEETAPKVVQMYIALKLKEQPVKETRKTRKAKRTAIRAKLGALTPAEQQEQPHVDANAEA